MSIRFKGWDRNAFPSTKKWPATMKITLDEWLDALQAKPTLEIAQSLLAALHIAVLALLAELVHILRQRLGPQLLVSDLGFDLLALFLRNLSLLLLHIGPLQHRFGRVHRTLSPLQQSDVVAADLSVAKLRRALLLNRVVHLGADREELLLLVWRYLRLLRKLLHELRGDVFLQVCCRVVNGRVASVRALADVVFEVLEEGLRFVAESVADALACVGEGGRGGHSEESRVDSERKLHCGGLWWLLNWMTL